jgi:hypothetical protein
VSNAGDEKHHPDGAEQDEQRRAHTADDGVAQWLDGEAHFGIDVWIGAMELGSGELHLRIGLNKRDTGFEKASGEEVMALVGAVGFELEGEPDVGCGVGDEVLAEDTDDGVGLVAKRKSTADDFWTAAELALPEAVA